MKRSIRRQLLVTFVGTMVIALLAIALINHLFLGRFYESRKVKEIEKAYKTINSLDSLAEEDFNSAIMEIAIQDNLQILITDEDFTTVRSTSRDAKELAARLFGYYTGFYRDKITVVETADFYTIQKTKDISINTSYLEMWGQLDNGKWFLIRTPIESIENAVNLSNYFYLCIGALVTSIAVISIIVENGDAVKVLRQGDATLTITLRENDEGGIDVVSWKQEKLWEEDDDTLGVWLGE